jgi:hypothetical protein
MSALRLGLNIRLDLTIGTPPGILSPAGALFRADFQAHRGTMENVQAALTGRAQGRVRLFLLGLRRITTSGQYFAEVDGLRFVAIASVFLFHVSGDVVRRSSEGEGLPSGWVFRLAQQLNVGVPLFFAISGMILALPFASYRLMSGKRPSLKRYFLRRLTRLEPPYIASLLILFVLKMVAHRGTASEMFPHLGASLLYLHNLIYRDMSSINPIAWSLEVEVQFYILAPLLSLIFCLRSTAWRRLLIVTCIAVAAACSPWTDMSSSRKQPCNMDRAPLAAGKYTVLSDWLCGGRLLPAETAGGTPAPGMGHCFARRLAMRGLAPGGPAAIRSFGAPGNYPGSLPFRSLRCPFEQDIFEPLDFRCGRNVLLNLPSA